MADIESSSSPFDSLAGGKSESPKVPPSQVADASHRVLVEILETLQNSTIANSGGKDAQSQFWATYQEEVAEHDNEFLSKYKSDMDIVLIFAGLFSAVSTSFIVSLSPNLSPNPNDTTNVLLELLIHTINNNTFPGQAQIPTWNGPDATIVWIQAVMYAALATSLLAALGAFLGKQWLTHYDRHGRGSVAARGRCRQQKFDGLQAWYFDAVLEVMPLLLQVSLLLFGVALGAYLWTQQQAVASVVIGATTFGVLFYVVIVISSLVSSVCPYQTPASMIIRASARWVVHHYEPLQGNHSSGAITLRSLLYIPYQIVNVFYLLPTWLVSIGASTVEIFKQSPSATSSIIYSSPQPCTLITEPSDTPSVLWVLETSTDPEVITAVARMVPNVEWSYELDISCVLLQLRDSFLGCFERVQSGYPQLVPLGHDRALACGKALLYIYLERQNIDNRQLPPLFEAPLMSTPHSGTHLPSLAWLSNLRLQDTELAFVCKLLRNIFVRFEFQSKLILPDIPDTALPWILHPILHCLCDPNLPMQARNVIIDAISRLLTVPLPPRNVLADCLLAAGLLTGLPVHRRDLIKLDKSDFVETILRVVLQQLQLVLPINSDASWSDHHSLCALKLLQPLTTLLKARQFRRIFYSSGAPLWSLHLSRILTQEAIEGVLLLGERAWDYARSALHFSISTGGDLALPLSAVQRMWELDGLEKSEANRAESLIHVDVRWLIEYIEHYRESFDEVAIGDALLALSVLPRVLHYNKKSLLLDTMIWAMGPSMSVRTRHSALKLAQTLRGVLSNTKDGGTHSTLLSVGFSAALCSAAFPRPYIRPSDVSGNPNQSYPDDFLFYQRDLSYLQIVFSLSRDDSWTEPLLRDGHYNRCSAIARAIQYVTMRDSQFSHMSAYLTAILGRAVLDSMPSDSLGDDTEYTLIFRAWDFLQHGPGADVSAALPAVRSIIEHTVSFVNKSKKTPEELVASIAGALKRLKRGAMDVQEPIISSVEALLIYMNENTYS